MLTSGSVGDSSTLPVLVGSIFSSELMLLSVFNSKFEESQFENFVISLQA